MSELRDFFYLDISKVHSFVSQIHGGLVSEINETIKRIGGFSAGINLGSLPVGGKLDASKAKESEQQQTIQLTSEAYFSILHKYLQNENEIDDLENIEDDQLQVGQFVEIDGIANPPIIDAWLGRINETIAFLDRNANLILNSMPTQQRKNQRNQFSRNNIDELKAYMAFLEDFVKFSQTGDNRLYINVSEEIKQRTIWFGLIPEYCLVPLHSTLPAPVRVVGRVERILNENETLPLVDFSQPNQAPANIDALISAVNNAGKYVGGRQVSQDDFVAKYPDIFVTPVAIYR